MELLHDGTLRDRVQRGPLPVAAVDGAASVAGANPHAACASRVKPANCFTAADGTVKVGDFDLSISTLAAEHCSRKAARSSRRPLLRRAASRAGHRRTGRHLHASARRCTFFSRVSPRTTPVTRRADRRGAGEEAGGRARAPQRCRADCADRDALLEKDPAALQITPACVRRSKRSSSGHRRQRCSGCLWRVIDGFNRKPAGMDRADDDRGQSQQSG